MLNSHHRNRTRIAVETYKPYLPHFALEDGTSFFSFGVSDESSQVKRLQKVVTLSEESKKTPNRSARFIHGRLKALLEEFTYAFAKRSIRRAGGERVTRRVLIDSDGKSVSHTKKANFTR